MSFCNTFHFKFSKKFILKTKNCKFKDIMNRDIINTKEFSFYFLVPSSKNYTIQSYREWSFVLKIERHDSNIHGHLVNDYLTGGGDRYHGKIDKKKFSQ